jgi:predicted RNA binding protein YcfA (HicA-like mRNA interferase family)
MSNFPSVKAKEFIRVIEKLGFYFDRQKGSHAIYKNIQGKRVVVPIHSGKDIKQGTLLTKRLFSNYSKNKAIAPSPPTNHDRLNLKIKQRSPLTTHKPRSPFPSNQTAIATQQIC